MNALLIGLAGTGIGGLMWVRPSDQGRDSIPVWGAASSAPTAD